MPRFAARLALCALLAPLAGCGEEQEMFETSLVARSLFYDDDYLGEALGVEMHESPFPAIGREETAKLLAAPPSFGLSRDFPLVPFNPPEAQTEEDVERRREELRAEARARMMGAEKLEELRRKRAREAASFRNQGAADSTGRKLRTDLRLVLVFNSRHPIPAKEACSATEPMGQAAPLAWNGFTADLVLCKGEESLANGSLQASSPDRGRSPEFVKAALDRLMVAVFGNVEERRALQVRSRADGLGGD